jgi:hypothetical protein
LEIAKNFLLAKFFLIKNNNRTQFFEGHRLPAQHVVLRRLLSAYLFSRPPPDLAQETMMPRVQLSSGTMLNYNKLQKDTIRRARHV